MAEKSKFVVEYSRQSLINAKDIVFYLRIKFSEKEVNNFYLAISDFEKIITVYPILYPESSKKGIRRAVLSKVLTIYYSVKKNKIRIVAIFDNRWDENMKL